MEKRSILRNDVIVAGLGGMGVLVAGKILAVAALKVYRHVSWFPSYAVEKRGGLCECTVIFSDNEIPSPIIDKAQSVVVFTTPQLKAFESRVRPGGMILVDSAGLREDERTRMDYELITLPGMQMALDMGGLQVNNLIFLGAYVGITDTIPVELVEEAMDGMLGADDIIKGRNRTALRRGIEIGASMG